MPNIETSTSDVVTSGGREGGKRREGKGGREREGGREGGRGGGREGEREKVSHLVVTVLVCVYVSCSNFWNNNNGMSFKRDTASAVTNGSNISNFNNVIIS